MGSKTWRSHQEVCVPGLTGFVRTRRLQTHRISKNVEEASVGPRGRGYGNQTPLTPQQFPCSPLGSRVSINAPGLASTLRGQPRWREHITAHRWNRSVCSAPPGRRSHLWSGNRLPSAWWGHVTRTAAWRRLASEKPTITAKQKRRGQNRPIGRRITDVRSIHRQSEVCGRGLR